MTWENMEELLVAASEAEDEETQLDIMALMWERERVEAEQMERAVLDGKYPEFLWEDE